MQALLGGVQMESRTCVVIFHETTGRCTGQILKGGEVVKELSFYLGKLHSTEPEVVESLIQKRYEEWAKVNGVPQIQVQYEKE
jgi:hypothetical protein